MREGSATASPAGDAAAQTARLVEIVAALREHCPWTAALTHASLTEYLLEESYELLEAIEQGTPEEVAGELGDVLYQVVVHARLAQEAGGCDFAAVVQGLSEKLLRRNPHVFHPDGSLRQHIPATVPEIVRTWDAVKRAERAAAGAGSAGPGAPHAAFSGIPAALPALALAHKSLDRAARGGLPVEGTVGTGTWDAGVAETEDALGEQLLDLVRQARSRGLDAERALRGAVYRFQRR